MEVNQSEGLGHGPGDVVDIAVEMQSLPAISPACLDTGFCHQVGRSLVGDAQADKE